MKKLILALALLCASISFADDKVVRKIKIYHADPLYIAQLLSGSTTYFSSPEPMSLSRLNTGSQGFGGMNGNGLNGGRGGL
jgi:hypothetical protein